MYGFILLEREREKNESEEIFLFLLEPPGASMRGSNVG